MTYKKLKLITIPNPLLKKTSEPVQEINEEVRALMDNMAYTNFLNQGAGLAAVQVAEMKRVFIADESYYDQIISIDGEKPPKKPEYTGSKEEQAVKGALKFANPEFLELSEETISLEEGCQSLPGIGVTVKRSLTAKMKYLGYDGKEHVMEAKDILARCFQHEMDHLNGVLITDYVSLMKRNMLHKKVEKFLKKYEYQ